MTPIWYRLMRRLKDIGGFAPNMQSLLYDAGVDGCHGRRALNDLADKKLIALGPGGRWSRPVQLIENNPEVWIQSIYGGEQ